MTAPSNLMLIPLLVPLAAIIGACKARSMSPLGRLALALPISLFFYVVSPWGLAPSYWLRYFVLGGALFVAVYALTNGRHSKGRHWGWWRIVAAQALFFLFLTASALFPAKESLPSLEIASPFNRGPYAVVQGGSSPLRNGHVALTAQSRAVDIVELNKWGSRATTLNPRHVGDFVIYGAPVFSPCNGTVVTAVTTHPDQPLGSSDTTHPAGNYIAIDCGSDTILILAHFASGTVAVTEGETVRTGDFLGAVGNSGNTTEPHLHMHAVSLTDGEPLFEGTPRALSLNGRHLSRNTFFQPE